MIAYASVVIGLVGLVTYALAPEGSKAGKLGYAAFTCGLLASLLAIGQATVKLLH